MHKFRARWGDGQRQDAPPALKKRKVATSTANAASGTKRGKKKLPTVSQAAVAGLGDGNIKLAVRGYVMDVATLVEKVLPDGSQYRGVSLNVSVLFRYLCVYVCSSNRTHGHERR